MRHWDRKVTYKDWIREAEGGEIRGTPCHQEALSRTGYGDGIRRKQELMEVGTIRTERKGGKSKGNRRYEKETSHDSGDSTRLKRNKERHIGHVRNTDMKRMYVQEMTRRRGEEKVDMPT